MDKANIFKEDNGFNRIKSWLVGASDGQTYPINDYFLKFINSPRIKLVSSSATDDDCYLWDFGGIESEWDDIIGYKYDYCVDDPELDNVASRIMDGLMNFTNEVNAHPEKYFEKIVVDKEKTFKDLLCRLTKSWVEDGGYEHYNSILEFLDGELCREDYLDMDPNDLIHEKMRLVLDSQNADMEIVLSGIMECYDFCNKTRGMSPEKITEFVNFKD